MHPGVCCLLLGGFIFVLGLIQALSSRRFLGFLFGIELVLNAANLNFLGFLQIQPQRVELSALLIFVISFAAIETAVALAIFTWGTRHGSRLQSPFIGV